MIKHPENCGINHGSRCSCGMSEEAGENDGFKFKDIPPLEIIKVEEDGTMTIDKFVVETIVEHRCENLTTECDRLKEENKALRMVIERSDGKSMSAEELEKWISDNAVKGECPKCSYTIENGKRTKYKPCKECAVKGDR